MFCLCPRKSRDGGEQIEYGKPGIFWVFASCPSRIYDTRANPLPVVRRILRSACLDSHLSAAGHVAVTSAMQFSRNILLARFLSFGHPVRKRLRVYCSAGHSGG